MVLPIPRLPLPHELFVRVTGGPGRLGEPFPVHPGIVLEVAEVEVVGQLVQLLVGRILAEEFRHLDDAATEVLLEVLEEEEQHVWMVALPPGLEHVREEGQLRDETVDEEVDERLQGQLLGGLVVQVQVVKV